MIPFSSEPEILSLLDNNVGVVLVFRDVIELIKTEQELLKVKKIDFIRVPAGGYPNDPVMASCQIYGFCAALVKPFEIQELAKVITHVMILRPQEL